MGYSYRNGDQIKDYHPDDTDTEMYLISGGGWTLSQILEKAQRKWPDATLDNIEIEAEYIHTSCLTYDRYDPSDYTNFIKVIKNG